MKNIFHSYGHPLPVTRNSELKKLKGRKQTNTAIMKLINQFVTSTTKLHF